MPLFNPSSSGGGIALRFRSEASATLEITPENVVQEISGIVPNRTKASFFNTANKVAYLKCGSGASETSWTVKIDPNGYYETPVNYTGPISVIWPSGVGSTGRGMYTEFIDAIE